jgi:hypothetical protein
MKALGRGSVASIVKVVLDIVWVLIWIGAIGIIAATLAFAVASIMAAAGREVFFESGGLKITSDGVLAITAEGRVLDWRILVPALLVGITAIAGALAVVWRLKQLFRNFSAGDPFAPDNPRHLRAIWITLVAVELARYGIMLAFGIILLAAGVPEGVDADFQIDLSAWFLILVIIVLAEVFREGARLHEEQKLTI